MAIPLYLAVPEDIYITAFDEAIQNAVRNAQIRLIIVNLQVEVVTQWIA